MKQFRNTSVLCIILLLLISLITIKVVQAAYNTSDLWEGNTIYIAYDADYRTDNTLLCAEHGQRLYSRNYKIIKKVTLSGTGSEDDAKLVSILQNDRRTVTDAERNQGTEPQAVQNAVWDFLPTWLNSSSNTYGIPTDFAKRGGTLNDNRLPILAEANNYANQMKNYDIIDNTDTTKIVVTTYEENDKSYARIGPFKISGGKFDSIKVITSDNREINPTSYGYYSGSTFVTTTEPSDITSNQEFYATFELGNFESVKKLKVSKTLEIKTATIWFLQCTDGSNQNLIRYTHSSNAESFDKEFEYDIPLVGSMEIMKQDETTQVALANVEFTLKCISGLKADQYVSIDSSGNAVYSTEEKSIATDSNGKISISYMWPGEYQLTEINNPNPGYEAKSLSTENITIKAGSKSSKTINNRREYIKLSGYVWEDILWEIGKQSYVNELYKDVADDINDKLLANVIVKLKDKDGNDVEFKDSPNGNVVRTTDNQGNTVLGTKTDSNGTYQMYDIEIDRLSELYIEFTYNGMSFESIKVVDLAKENSSKALEPGEKGKTRTEFNEEYATITKGKSNAHDLIYDTEDYKSTIHLGDNLLYGYEGQDKAYPVNGVYKQYEMTSNTYNAYKGYIDTIKSPEEIRNEGTVEITNINLGLKKREQPDLSVIKDIYSAKVTINGAHHIYRYGERFTEPNRDIAHNEQQIRFGQERGAQTYTRPLYASDIAYEGNDPLEVKVTYQIEVRNNATDISAFVNGLSDYYDSKYEYNIINVGTQIYGEGSGVDEGSIVPGSEIEYSSESINNNEYTKINLKPNLELIPQTEKTIYLELKVQKDRIKDLVVAQDEIKEVKLDNIVEITSYGSFKEIYDTQGNIIEKRTYAGIDKDSQPDNMVIGEKTTYEDDTDSAPGLLLILQDDGNGERTIDGTVFEDEAVQSGTGNIRQGDGQYTNADHGIEGIVVEVRRTSNGELAQMYDGSNWVDATDTTDESGNYRIGGLVPDDYYITYTWGGQTYTDTATGETTTYTVQDYKGTIVDENIYTAKESNNQWYKETDPRYSDAIDDYNTRIAIDDEIKDITYEKKEQMAQGNLSNNTMKSTTPSFKINVEYDSESSNMNDTITENAIKNIDFGIVERARQTLGLDKYVKHLKITLANGNSIIDTDIELDGDGNIIGKPSYITYMPESPGAKGIVKVEIDSELVQGAILETTYGLKVTNVGEIDYSNERYYYYGSGHGETESEMVTLKATEIIDYLDDKLSVEMQTNNVQWNTLTDAQLSDYIGMDTGKYLSNTTERRQYLNTVDRVITTDTLKDIGLKPISGQNTIDNITLVGTRLLSNNEETFLENNAEIIHVEKTGGSSLTTIPGNYVPTDLLTSEADDDYSEEISVVPPTGSNDNTISYIILGISSLAILVAGIVLIKRYVIK